MKQYLLDEDSFKVAGTNREERMQRVAAFVRKAFSLAMAGEGWAFKLVWNYVDGLPYFSGKIVMPKDDEEEAGLDAEQEAAVKAELDRLILGEGIVGNGKDHG